MILLFMCKHLMEPHFILNMTQGCELICHLVTHQLSRSRLGNTSLFPPSVIPVTV